MAIKRSACPPECESEPGPEPEARRLKSIAESKLRSSAFNSALKYARRARALSPNLDGISLLLTAIKILRSSPSDHYQTLRLDPFAPLPLVKKQYKTLALALHPDKSAASRLPGSEEAFKRISASFRFLSDPTNKRRFDDKLRIMIAGEREVEVEEEDRTTAAETFWTSCATCRIRHEFDRRYVGSRLVCPSCHKSFVAVEMRSEEEKDDSRVIGTRSKSRSQSQSRVSVDSKKRKVVDSGSSESKKPRREQTLAEMQLEIAKTRAKQKEKQKSSKKARVFVEEEEEEEEEEEDLSVIAVEDSDFYNFDKDRTEKSVKKGQIWAIYDDDDGMPRHYGLIEDVACLNRFRVKMSWLVLQNDGDESLLLWEKSGYHVSCGRFKLGNKVNIDSVNYFSHTVECERAGKEVYRIYPKKGSVWALYGERASRGEGERCYDIVVFLTSYSEMYGLSMAHLEKVEGYKTIFKRKEIGPHAITWLEKEDVKLFSHQIPARKLSGEEDENLPGECWELDPASLPSALLHMDCGEKRRTLV